ncbi:iron-sulfur cluster assembly accessory protein [Rickettsiales endosymbiont of Peranema trichophorum]|uniref:HesB/IscA family protein n=1 Tax=Rickettsiales endosymbiont of Peranema trichophorum TaxID=2486577 RepID=UPI001023BE3C|nr:iron-sulfur cluster assembly accessory protein [Rickettsiales endosymbiont of Peranema trichophorum]RZI45388.1 iron-sulfur cluster assembly accessory protein [Rickettsiales endosymbiont of Peranema trichophorum]
MDCNFFITQSAANKILALRNAESSPHLKLRIQIFSGGCKGFQYDMSFVTEADDSIDQHFPNRDESLVVIDSISAQFLSNGTLDYYEDLSGAGFQIKNPNSSSRCGCGNSFTVE